MAPDKFQHYPTSHMLREKKRIKEDSQVARKETCQTLVQAIFFWEFIIIYGLWHSEIIVPGARLWTLAGISLVKETSSYIQKNYWKEKNHQVRLTIQKNLKKRQPCWIQTKHLSNIKLVLVRIFLTMHELAEACINFIEGRYDDKFYLCNTVFLV